jgi:hypothetical protein
VFPFALLDDVTTKLDNLKIVQVFDAIHSSVPSPRINGVGNPAGWFSLECQLRRVSIGG